MILNVDFSKRINTLLLNIYAFDYNLINAYMVFICKNTTYVFLI